MQPTTSDLTALVRGLARACGRHGVRLDATGLETGEVRLHLTQDPCRPVPLQTRAELEDGLRQAIAESTAWRASGVTPEITADPGAKWYVGIVDGELRVRHLLPPYQTAAVRSGGGEYHFDLRERGVYHLHPLGDTQGKHMRSLPRIAKQQIIAQQLFDALPD